MMTRRELLGAAVGSAATALNSSSLMGATADAPLQDIDLAAPANLLTAYIKLGGSLDDRLVIWWMSGTRYGVVNAQATPLYGMQVGMFHRFFRQADGSYKLAMFELTYYTDLESGKLMEKYANPYTGQVNEVMHVRLGPTIRHQTSEGQPRPANDRNIREYWSQLGPATVQGDQVWIPTDVKARIVLPFPQAPELRINHYTTLLGSLSAIADPTTISIPATLAFQNVLNWELWMKMADHPGHMMSRAAGRKMERLAEMPPEYLEMARAVHPWLIRDPVESLYVQVEKIRAGAG